MSFNVIIVRTAIVAVPLSYKYFVKYLFNIYELFLFQNFEIIIPTFMIATLLAVMVYRRKPFAIGRR